MNYKQIVEKAVQFAVNIAKDNSHGYNNSGDGWGPEYNCIGLVMQSFNKTGYNVGKVTIKNMPKQLLSKGFEDCTKYVDFSNGKGLEKGYILWMYDAKTGHGHTEMCTKPGYLVGARADYDHRKGDSSGHEIEEIKYWNDNWQRCFRLKGAYEVPKKYNYIVQCGVFSVKANADNLKKKLVKSGFDCIVYKKGNSYYVQCGSFSVKANADKLAGQIKAKGFSVLIRKVEV